LFRHEVAFVFGQLQHQASIPALTKVLSNTAEAGMVRHEAAEALGSIGTTECYKTLRLFLNDESQVVRESCVVGLDMLAYEQSGELDYAPKLIN
jgi:deoxyhypusine monooxygenase